MGTNIESGIDFSPTLTGYVSDCQFPTVVIGCVTQTLTNFDRLSVSLCLPLTISIVSSLVLHCCGKTLDLICAISPDEVENLELAGKERGKRMLKGSRLTSFSTGSNPRDPGVKLSAGLVENRFAENSKVALKQRCVVCRHSLNLSTFHDFKIVVHHHLFVHKTHTH